jgi:hypothetical protein
MINLHIHNAKLIPKFLKIPNNYKNINIEAISAMYFDYEEDYYPLQNF